MAVATGTALLIVGGIAAAGAVGSALISADASKDAAREQRRSLAKAQEAQAAGVLDANALQQPFLETGTQAFNQLSDIVQSQATQGASPMPQFNFDISQLQNDPGVKFAQSQGRNTIEASAAARGGVFTGGTLQELQERAIGLGGQQVNSAFNRQLGTFQQNMAGRNVANAEEQQLISNLSQVAQVGPQAASNLSNIAIGHAGNISDLAIQGGNVNAAERVAQGQAVNQAIGGVTKGAQDAILLQSLLANNNSQTIAPVNAQSGGALPTGAGDLARLNQAVA